MKSFKTVATGLLALSLAAGIAAPAFAQDKTLIRLAHPSADDLNITEQMFSWTFANYVNDNSDTLEVKVFPNSQLGESRDVIEGMQLGAGASATFGGIGEYAAFVPEAGVMGLPFLWESYDHVHKIVDGELGELVAAKMEENGFKIVAWSDAWGYRNVVTATKDVKTPEDLNGLKIRTIPNQVFVAAVNAMGANATPMNFGEIYTSLESGVLDGFEHTASTVVTNKFYEITCCVALTRHLFDPTVLTFSLAVWEGLTEKEQEVLIAGGKIASDVVRALAPVREAEAYAQLVELGMTINEIDTAPLRAAAQVAQGEIAADIGVTDLLEVIRNAN